MDKNIFEWTLENEVKNQMTITRNRVNNAFVNLVKKYGENIGSGFAKRLMVFEYCSSYGIELEDSTIDCIEITMCDDVFFHFNYNEVGDFKTLKHFDLVELAKFYDKLKEVIQTSNKA